MRRPTDWSPMRGSDPTPGDPRELERVATGCKNTAAELLGQAARLRALAGDHGWDSDAGSLWRVKARQIAGQLDRVVDRYQETGAALATYADELERVQASADRAREEGQAAHREEQRLAEEIARAQAAAAGAPEGSPPVNTSGLEAARRRAHERYVAAESQITCAEGSHEAAAEAAARRIQHVNAEDGLEDSRWDKAEQWVSDHAKGIKKIADVAGWVATGAGLAALAVGWIPVVGQALAAVLGAVALLTTLMAMVAHIALALSGDGSWLDVGIDVFALATLGIGRGALAGIKGGAKATRALGVQARADELLAGKVATATRGGKTLKKGQLRNLTRGAVAQARGELGMSGRAVAGALSRPARAVPRPREVLRGLDPRTLTRETVEGVEDLFDGPAWRRALQEVRAGRPGTGLLDDEAVRALKDLDTLPAAVRDLPVVDAASDATRRGVKVFYGSTGAAVVVDGLDKRGAFDRGKPYLVREVR